MGISRHSGMTEEQREYLAVMGNLPPAMEWKRLLHPRSWAQITCLDQVSAAAATATAAVATAGILEELVVSPGLSTLEKCTYGDHPRRCSSLERQYYGGLAIHQKIFVKVAKIPWGRVGRGWRGTAIWVLGRLLWVRWVGWSGGRIVGILSPATGRLLAVVVRIRPGRGVRGMTWWSLVSRVGICGRGSRCIMP